MNTRSFTHACTCVRVCVLDDRKYQSYNFSSHPDLLISLNFPAPVCVFSVLSSSVRCVPHVNINKLFLPVSRLWPVCVSPSYGSLISVCSSPPSNYPAQFPFKPEMQTPVKSSSPYRSPYTKCFLPDLHSPTFSVKDHIVFALVIPVTWQSCTPVPNPSSEVVTTEINALRQKKWEKMWVGGKGGGLVIGILLGVDLIHIARDRIVWTQTSARTHKQTHMHAHTRKHTHTHESTHTRIAVDTHVFDV